LAGHLVGQIIAQLGHGAGAADADPFPAEDPLEFPLAEALIGIDRGRHRDGILEAPRDDRAQLGERRRSSRVHARPKLCAVDCRPFDRIGHGRFSVIRFAWHRRATVRIALSHIKFI